MKSSVRKMVTSSGNRVRLAAGAVIGIGIAAIPLLVERVSGGARVGGAPAWAKPLKFAVSVALYCATIDYLVAHIPGHRRSVRVIVGCTAIAVLGELTLVVVQACRGRASHFNTATPTDAAIYAAMGGLAGVIFSVAVVAEVLLWRCEGVPRPLAAAARAGLLVALLGMAEAALMVVHGAHTVGAADGGPGLPLTGWSTTHGDLRVAHFVGLHALQALPGYAWLLTRFAPRTPPVHLIAMVDIAAVLYAGLVIVLTWQAERGEPLLRPSGAVALTAAGLVSAGIVATLLAARTSVVPLARF